MGCCDPDPTIFNDLMHTGFLIVNKDLVYKRALWRVCVLKQIAVRKDAPTGASQGLPHLRDLRPKSRHLQLKGHQQAGREHKVSVEIKIKIKKCRNLLSS